MNPSDRPTDAQLLLAQFVFCKMEKVPATSEGVEMLKRQHVPNFGYEALPPWWLAWDFLFTPWYEIQEERR